MFGCPRRLTQPIGQQGARATNLRGWGPVKPKPHTRLSRGGGGGAHSCAERNLARGAHSRTARAQSPL
eukprot:3287145-Amphidinium_carterae.1